MTHRGFTLLLAVLVSSIMLALGSAIYNIAAKEVILSSSGRDSQYAFYSADSGIECALYWDEKQNAFSSTSAATQMTCAGQTVSMSKSYDVPSQTETTNVSFTPIPCIDLTVTKQDGATIRTTIQSYGYNTCTASDPRRIERAIRVQY